MYCMNKKTANYSENGVESRLEMDNHADTVVIGHRYFPIQYYGRPINVYGYYPVESTKDFMNITGTVAYDHPQSGKWYIIVYNQVIYCNHFSDHLMSSI